jgi:hypothetical protein
MKFITSLLLFISTVFAQNSPESCNLIIPSNNCVNFQVSSGTGCAWMCNYCASSLGTNNYYFTNGVCTYQEGIGCVGNPQTGVTYTCCSA